MVMIKCNWLLIFMLFDCSYSYKRYTVENPDVCSLNTKRRLKLGAGTKSGIVLTQNRLNDHLLLWNSDFLCKFEVKADWKKEGIFAVIQSLSLRKDDLTGECVDYVQFKRKDGSTSEKICGHIRAPVAMSELFFDKNENQNSGPNLIAGNAFEDPMGELDVYIYVDRQPLLIREETNLTIVFTAYKHCSEMTNIFKDGKCISTAFLNDGYYNLPYYDCIDENGCPEDAQTETKESIGNKVLIGSVASMLLMFGIFICCIYLCRKYGKLCWSDSFSSPQIPTTVTQAPLASQIRDLETIDVDPTPSAPSNEDKDLPPSYDSLFPSR